MRYFDEIAKKAQELSGKNGKTENNHLDIWLEAERIIMAGQEGPEAEEHVEKKETIKRSWLLL